MIFFWLVMNLRDCIRGMWGGGGGGLEGVIVDFSCSVMNLGDCVRGSGAGGVTGDSFLVFLNVGDC